MSNLLLRGLNTPIIGHLLALLWALQVGYYHIIRALLWFLRELSKKCFRVIGVLTHMAVVLPVVVLALLGNELRPGSTTDMLTHVVWTEARGETEAGRRAVIWTVHNRAEADQSYWGGSTYAGVIYDRRGAAGCEYDGVCRKPDMGDVRYNTAWFALWTESLDTLLAITFGLPDPTGGAHSYATLMAAAGSDYHQRLCGVVVIGNHRFGVDPHAASCRAPMDAPMPVPRLGQYARIASN